MLLDFRPAGCHSSPAAGYLTQFVFARVRPGVFRPPDVGMAPCPALAAAIARRSLHLVLHRRFYRGRWFLVPNLHRRRGAPEGDHCEIATGIHNGNLTQFDASKGYWASFINNVNNYAQQCYTNRSSGLVECSRFITDITPTATVDYKAACPFDESGICRQNNANLRLDTGHMNSNDIFGLNASYEETLTLRYVLQCAPLKTERWARNITVSNQNFTTYSYGKPQTSGKWEDINYTYSVPVRESWRWLWKQQSLNQLWMDPMLSTPLCWIPLLTSTTQHYSSEYFTIYEGSLVNSSSTFDPDPDIVAQDGDVSLFFLSGNGVGFESPSNDDWYQVTVPGGDRNLVGKPGEKAESKYWYRSREAASPLGCVEQYQWCRDPAAGQCGNLSGLLDALYSAAPWFDLTIEDINSDRPILPSKLASLFQWVYLVLFDHGAMITNLIETLGPTSIVSQTQQN
ncbi:Cation diffusion facilitator family metal ion [Apiospora saccharicola]|uniref:Cation diffusion facilitator family metal ion n=1 Tax=Apiospora saccharicola TaxID=335842 RepID=A0ABR1UPH8_9PEZI